MILSAPDSFARTCPRCGRTITPRGAEPPRFCAVCGLRLVPLHREVQQALATRAPAPTTAVVALLLGLGALLPMVGLPLGLAAIVVGGAAKDRIRQSQGQLGGRKMATTGVTLGIIMSIVWVLVCLGAR